MTPEILTQVLEKSISIGILLLMVWYFMKQIEKKDAINAENQREWMQFAREATITIVEARNSIVANTEKLRELHSDIQIGRFCKSK